MAQNVTHWLARVTVFAFLETWMRDVYVSNRNIMIQANAYSTTCTWYMYMPPWHICNELQIASSS